MNYEFHEYAAVFPLMDESALVSLAADIRANGLREPVRIFEGKILDGRNRSLACKRAGVEPSYQMFSGSHEEALKLVVSLNLERRHLTTSQRAMVADRLATLKPGRPEKTVEISTVSMPQAEAAKALNVSREVVIMARRVRESGAPELVAAVDSGKVAVSTAAAIATAPKAEQQARYLAPRVARLPRPVRALVQHAAARPRLAAGDPGARPEKEGGVRQKSPPYLREKARQLLEQGLTRRQIARRLRRKETTVTSWLTGLGGEVRKPWTQDDTRAVITMRAAGCKWRDICVAIGRREETIRAALRRRGVKLPYIYGQRGRRPKDVPPPPAKKTAKKKQERLESPCRPVSWRDWHEQRERERAAQQPPPRPPQIADDWEDKPIGAAR